MQSRLLTLGAALLASMAGASAPAIAATGAEVYQQQCAACHGATGAGDGPQAGKDNIAAPRPYAQSVADRMTVEKAMLIGVNNVPGHGVAPLLLPEELRQLIDHVYKLAKP